MPIAIALRDSANKNFFRDVLIDSLDSGNVDDALICSGFFQENFKGSAYRVSAERNLASVCVSNNVALTTVGIHNYTWKRAYKQFMISMRNAGVNITCLTKNGLSWHAKVFIARCRGRPILGAIGSSNMTRNAFSVGGRFNQECDVFLWPPKSTIASTIKRLSEEHAESIIRAPYSLAKNGGLTIAERLENLREEVLSQNLAELLEDDT